MIIRTNATRMEKPNENLKFFGESIGRRRIRLNYEFTIMMTELELRKTKYEFTYSLAVRLMFAVFGLTANWQLFSSANNSKLAERGEKTE